MTIARVFFCALALVAVGCGGDDDDGIPGGPSCSTAPCGGDITGTWTIDQTCPGVIPAENDQCPDAVIDITDGPNVTGTATFEAGGAYTLDVHVTAQVDVHVPAECTLNGLVGCDGVADLMQEDAPGATCVDGAEENSCDCDMPIDTDADEEGTWTTEGPTLTVTVDGEATDSQFCVQGTGLLVIMDNELGEVSVLGSK